jgi:hypothetical protein
MAGLFDAFGGMFGGSGQQAPDQTQAQAQPDQMGLTDAQRQMLGFNTIGSIGAMLLAAGQKQMPAQRAQYLAQLGNIPGQMQQQQTQMLQQQMLAQKAKAQQDVLKLTNSPEFLKSFEGMNPQMQALVQAAAKTGDINALAGLYEKTQPQFSGNMIVNKQAGTVTDTISGTVYDLNTGQPKQQEGGTNNEPVDVTKYGLPADTRVNPAFYGFNDAYRQKLADIHAGTDTLSGAARGSAGMMQRMQMDVQRAFPDYKPAESANRADIQKSMSNTSNATSLFNQRKVLGTFAEHLGGENMALDAAKDLPNGTVLSFNRAQGAFNNETGDPRITAFNTKIHQLQGEVAKAVNAGAVTVSEADKLEAQLSAANSPQQIRAALDSYYGLVNGKVRATDDAINSVMGSFYNPDKHSVATPKTREILDRYNNDSWARPQKQQPQAGAALAPGKYKFNPQTGTMEPM